MSEDETHKNFKINNKFITFQWKWKLCGLYEL